MSTYFPVKADIAVGPLELIFRQLHACLDDRPASESTLDALERWMKGEAEIGDETGQDLVRRAMARNPVLQVSERERMIGAERLIADSLEREHGLLPGDIIARVLASAAVAMTFELWGHKHVPESGQASRRAAVAGHRVLLVRLVALTTEQVRGLVGLLTSLIRTITGCDAKATASMATNKGCRMSGNEELIRRCDRLNSSSGRRRPRWSDR